MDTAMELSGGETVLVKAQLSCDGRTVTFAPGVEVGTSMLDIVTDVPVVRNQDGELAPAMILFFSNERELIDFANEFRGNPDVETRPI